MSVAQSVVKLDNLCFHIKRAKSLVLALPENPPAKNITTPSQKKGTLIIPGFTNEWRQKGEGLIYRQSNSQSRIRAKGGRDKRGKGRCVWPENMSYLRDQEEGGGRRAGGTHIDPLRWLHCGHFTGTCLQLCSEGAGRGRGQPLADVDPQPQSQDVW